MRTLTICLVLFCSIFVSVIADDEVPVDPPVDAVTDAPSDAPVETETDALVAETEAPVAETEAPVAETDAPVAETEAPVAETEAPVAETEAPVAETEAPAAKETEADKETEAPAKEPAAQDGASGSDELSSGPQAPADAEIDKILKVLSDKPGADPEDLVEAPVFAPTPATTSEEAVSEVAAEASKEPAPQAEFASGQDKRTTDNTSTKNAKAGVIGAGAGVIAMAIVAVGALIMQKRRKQSKLNVDSQKNYGGVSYTDK